MALMKILPMLVVFIAMVLAPVSANEMRTWQSKDGTETIEASFRSVDAGTLTVLLPSGRSRQVPLTNLSQADVEYVQKKQEPSAPPTQALGKMGEVLKGKLVAAPGAKESSVVPQYYIFYYSASWCPPCRAFTPDLVSFYNRTRSSDPEIEVVLVSADRTEEDALAYQRDYKMKFPQLKFDKINSKDIPGNPGRGIPALRMVNAAGETVLTSEEVGRDKFLTRAKQLSKGS